MTPIKFFFFLSLLSLLKTQQIPLNAEVYFTNIYLTPTPPDTLLAWTVKDASLDNDAALVLAQYTGASNQKFLISLDLERWYHIRAVHSAKEITVDSNFDGLRVFQRSPSTAPPGSVERMAQQFSINLRQWGDPDPDFCIGARPNNRWLQAETLFVNDLGWTLASNNVQENEATYGDPQKWKIRLA